MCVPGGWVGARDNQELLCSATDQKHMELLCKRNCWSLARERTWNFDTIAVLSLWLCEA